MVERQEYDRRISERRSGPRRWVEQKEKLDCEKSVQRARIWAGVVRYTVGAFLGAGITIWGMVLQYQRIEADGQRFIAQRADVVKEEAERRLKETEERLRTLEEAMKGKGK